MLGPAVCFWVWGPTGEKLPGKKGGKHGKTTDKDKSKPIQQEHRKPPTLPLVSLSHLAAHRRDASLATHLSRNLEASFSNFLQGAISSVDSIAGRAADVSHYRISRKASEPLPKESCECGTTWHPSCKLTCGFIAGELQQSAELLAVRGCSEDAGTLRDAGHRLILDVRVDGRPVTVELEHNNASAWFRIISGSFFIAEHAAPGTFSSGDIPSPGGDAHLLSSNGIRLGKPSWFKPSWFSANPIHDGSAIDGLRMLQHEYCNKEDLGGIVVTLVWPTKFDESLDQLGVSLIDLAGLMPRHHEVMTEFVHSCLSSSDALVRATLAVDPGEAMAIKPNAHAVQNRLSEEMQQLNETAESFLRFIDDVSRAKERAYQLANSTLWNWGSQMVGPKYSDDEGDVETDEWTAIKALAEWTPTQLEDTLVRAVDRATSYIQVHVKHILVILSRAASRAVRLLQPGQPPAEVEPGEIETYLQTPLYEVGVKARQSAEVNKAIWAERWSQLRDSLDFIPWPVDASEKPMQAPVVCEALWYQGENRLAKFPQILGGRPIVHTFMIFAGGEMPKRRGCEDLALRMAEAFVQLSPRDPHMQPKDRIARQQYSDLRKQAGLLGCQHLVQWGAIAAKVRQKIERNISHMQSLHFNITYNASSSRLVEIETGEGDFKKVPRNVMSALSNWVMHSLAKYASRSPGDMFKGVLKSLQTTKPQVDAAILAYSYWKQLQEQDIQNPFSDALCKRDQEGYVQGECAQWNSSVPGYWDSADLDAQSLEQVLSVVRDVEAAAGPNDWRLLAQSSAAFAAAGFDSPGIQDNSDWKCDRVAATCSVHPTCGRVAAQMISYPFGGNKKYASTSISKIQTYFGQKKGKFDADGFHSYCHVPGTAYCWSYTYCLQEMMKYLCSQPETAGVCCPDVQTAEACRDNVNGDGCKVCLPTDAPHLKAEEKEENITEFLSYLPPRREPTPLEETTLRWLQPSAEDIAKTEAAAAAELLAQQCQVCAELRSSFKKDSEWWLSVSAGAQCMAHREFCGQVCGLHDGNSAFEEPDPMSDCKGWTARCSEQCGVSA